jgi:hypothetical protein
MGLLHWLFDTSMGPPGPAGAWPAWLSVLFHGSNAIAGACMMIVPLMVMWHLPHRQGGVSARQLWMIMVLYLAFAGCRVARVLEIHGPPYHLTTIVDCAAAVICVYSVLYLPQLLRHIMELPSLEELNEVNNALSAGIVEAEAGKQEAKTSNLALVILLERAQGTLETLSWCDEKSRALDDIHAVLAEIQLKGATRGT